MSNGHHTAIRTEALARCPLCGGSGWVERFQAEDRLFGVPGRYRYVHCRSCGTVFQNPRVVATDLPRLYPDRYFTHAPPALATGARGSGLRRLRDRTAERVRAAVRPGAIRAGLAGRLLARSRSLRERAFHDLAVDELLPRSSPGRLLDVGCGTGRQMLQLARLGWVVEGLEWDPRAAEVARRVTGLPVEVGGVDQYHAERPFQAVLLHHVFEHLAAPAESLARLREVLVPGGRLVLVWPNPRSLGARRFGPAWLHWDPPRHLTIPSLEAAAAAASAVGLHPLARRTLAREASSTSAHSRRLRAGSPVDLERPLLDVADRLFGGLEHALLPARHQAGEEAVLVLAR